MLSEIATNRLRAALVWATREAESDPMATYGGAWDQSDWNTCIGHRLGVEYAREHATTAEYPWDDAYRALEVSGYDDGHADAGDLFYPFNTLRTLWTIAADLTDGDIVVPAELVEIGG